MSGQPSGWDLAGALGGATALCSMLGAGLWKLITRADRREASRERREAEMVTRLEARILALEEESRQLWMVIGYVVPALHVHDPRSPALRLAAKILRDRFPIDLNTPPDMADALNRIP